MKEMKMEKLTNFIIKYIAIGLAVCLTGIALIWLGSSGSELRIMLFCEGLVFLIATEISELTAVIKALRANHFEVTNCDLTFEDDTIKIDG